MICTPPGGELDAARRRDALLDFADVVEYLDGRYITAEDVGVGPEDLVAIGERTAHVTGLPPEHGGSGDPSPFTALGVEAAMRACCARAFGDADLSGRRIAVIGLGRVGSRLARLLADAGAELVLTDIAAERRRLADELGAEWAEPGGAMLTECDVLAPCALGGAIDDGNVERIRAPIVCGSANNQLADEDLAARLEQRGVLYAPDFIANAGGLIHVYREIKGYSGEHALDLVVGIEDTLARILAVAAERGITPLDAARELARERLHRPQATIVGR